MNTYYLPGGAEAAWSEAGLPAWELQRVHLVLLAGVEGGGAGPAAALRQAAGRAPREERV